MWVKHWIISSLSFIFGGFVLLFTFSCCLIPSVYLHARSRLKLKFIFHLSIRRKEKKKLARFRSAVLSLFLYVVFAAKRTVQYRCVTDFSWLTRSLSQLFFSHTVDVREFSLADQWQPHWKMRYERARRNSPNEQQSQHQKPRHCVVGESVENERK